MPVNSNQCRNLLSVICLLLANASKVGSKEREDVMGKWGLAVGTALVLLMSIASGTQATIIFDPTPTGTGDNVVFNQQPSNQSGTTIFGNINDPNDTLGLVRKRLSRFCHAL